MLFAVNMILSVGALGSLQAQAFEDLESNSIERHEGSHGEDAELISREVGSFVSEDGQEVSFHQMPDGTVGVGIYSPVEGLKYDIVGSMDLDGMTAYEVWKVYGPQGRQAPEA